MSLRKNALANFVGQGWAALMAIAFVPLYIKYLGIEAYGLIGVFTIMQAWLSLIDMGMTPTLSREMARYTAGARNLQSTHNLLRSLEVICGIVSICVCILVWLASGWLAETWLKPAKMSPTTITQTISVMAIVISLRFVEGLFRSALVGLQRQVWYNLANAALSTVRSIGAVGVLAWVSPTIDAFFLWQALVSLLAVAVLAIGVHQSLPPPPSAPYFSIATLADVWSYAKGMAAISLLSLLLTQVDKLLLSKLLTLESFGYYTLAATVSSVLYMVINPIVTAAYPRLVELSAKATQSELTTSYHLGAQYLVCATAPIALLLILFGEGILFTWSGDSNIANSAGSILSTLALGTFLNGLMFFPYHLQLAHGWTSLTIKINVISVLVAIPAILWVTPRYGPIGAAWVWVALNLAYILVGVQLMHRVILIGEKWEWYFKDLLLPVTGSLGLMLIVIGLKPVGYESRSQWLGFLCFAFSLGVVGAALGSNTIRARAHEVFAKP